MKSLLFASVFSAVLLPLDWQLLSLGVPSAARIMAAPPAKPKTVPRLEELEGFASLSPTDRQRAAAYYRKLESSDLALDLLAYVKLRAEFDGATVAAQLIETYDPAKHEFDPQRLAKIGAQLAKDSPQFYAALLELAPMDITGRDFHHAVAKLARQKGVTDGQVIDAANAVACWAKAAAAEPQETIAEFVESKRAATGFSSSEARTAARKAREVLDGPEGLYERERVLARMDARDPSFAAGVRETAELFQISNEDVINGARALAVMGLCADDADDGKRAAPRPGPAVKPARPSYAQLQEQRRRTVPARVQVQRSIAAAQAQAAQAQAAADAARQQQPNNNSGPDPYVLGMLLYPQGSYPGPVPYGGPFNETISRYGNQTYINGSGFYGPFNETISRYGNQTYINGSGPYGPFNETISRYGNQTYINGSGSPYPFGPYGGFGGGY